METKLGGLIYIARGDDFRDADEGCVAIMELWLPAFGDIQVRGTIEKDGSGGFYFEPETKGAPAMDVDFSDEADDD